MPDQMYSRKKIHCCDQDEEDTRELRRELLWAGRRKADLVSRAKGENPFDICKGRVSELLDRLGERRNVIPLVDLSVGTRSKGRSSPSPEPSPDPSPRSRVSMDERPWRKAPEHVPQRKKTKRFIMTMDGTLTVNPQAPFGHVVRCLKRHIMMPYKSTAHDDPLLVGGVQICSKCDKNPPVYICKQCTYEYYLCGQCASGENTPNKSASPKVRVAAAAKAAAAAKNQAKQPAKKEQAKEEDAQPVVREGRKLLDMLVAEHGGGDYEETKSEDSPEPKREPSNDPFENMSDYSLAGSIRRTHSEIRVTIDTEQVKEEENKEVQEEPAQAEEAAPESPQKDSPEKPEVAVEKSTEDAEGACEEEEKKKEESLKDSNADLSTEELMKKLADALGEWDATENKRAEEEEEEEEEDEEEKQADDTGEEANPPDEGKATEAEAEGDKEADKTPSTPGGDEAVVEADPDRPRTRKEMLADIFGAWEEEPEVAVESKAKKEPPTLLEEWKAMQNAETEGEESEKASPSAKSPGGNLNQTRSSIISELSLPGRNSPRNSPPGSLKSSLKKPGLERKNTFGSGKRFDFVLNQVSPGPGAYNVESSPEHPEWEPPIIRPSSWAKSSTKRVSIQQDISTAPVNTT